ncbi:MAG: DHH family phosphoesterase [Candidatus Buchananbacteria bacterium]
MDFTAISQKIYQQISEAQNILLIAHPRPDADALGSLVAFGLWLESLGKTHDKFCVDQPDSNLAWLTDYEPIITDPKYILAQQYDLIVVLDSGDLRYAGVDQVLPQFLPLPLIINIDHHNTNRNFGTINLVDSNAVSTTQIIFQFFKTLRVRISAKQATALLAGIIYDTYNFTNPNTNDRSLEITSDLLRAGALLPQVSDSILRNKTVDALQVWGKILTRLSYNAKLGVAFVAITKDDLEYVEFGAEITKGVANFLNNLAGVKAVLILEQQSDDIIKGSLRTNEELIDVSELAKMLGGGGHKKAAGFKLNGRLISTEKGFWQIV